MPGAGDAAVRRRGDERRRVLVFLHMPTLIEGRFVLCCGKFVVYRAFCVQQRGNNGQEARAPRSRVRDLAVLAQAAGLFSRPERSHRCDV